MVLNFRMFKNYFLFQFERESIVRFKKISKNSNKFLSQLFKKNILGINFYQNCFVNF